MAFKPRANRMTNRSLHLAVKRQALDEDSGGTEYSHMFGTHRYCRSLAVLHGENNRPNGMGSKSCRPHLNARGMGTSWLRCGDWPSLRRYPTGMTGRSLATASSSYPDVLPVRRLASGVSSNTLSFSLFPKLPVELRLRIWTLVSEQLRIILIASSTPKDDTKAALSFVSLSPPPAVLHVCTESRNIALTKYNLWSMSASEPRLNSQESKEGDHLEPLTYVNFAQDMFYFRIDHDDRTPDGRSCLEAFVRELPASILQEIQLVGIDINTTGNCYVCDWEFLKKLPGLQALYLCRETDGLALGSYLRYSSITKECKSAFVADYRANFSEVHPYLTEESDSVAAEEIKTDCIYWWYDSEREDFEAARKPEIFLVIIDDF